MWIVKVIQKGDYGKEELEFAFRESCDAFDFAKDCLEAGVCRKTKVEIMFEEDK